MGNSQTWGVNGELYVVGGRLSDWTGAGYHGDGSTPPSATARVTVSSAANILAEVDSGTAGVIAIAAGTYTMTAPIILHSGQVLRGAGRGTTIIRYTQSLFDLLGYSPDAYIDGPGGANNGGIGTGTNSNNTFGYASDYALIEAGRRYSPSFTGTGPITEVGIEDLTIALVSGSTTPAHFAVRGFSGIEFADDCQDCWIRRVDIQNADNAIRLERCTNITVDDVWISAAGRTVANANGFFGHYGIQCFHEAPGTTDASNLIRNITVAKKLHHTFSVEDASLCVFCDSTFTVDGNLDHHKDNPNRNLFTNINVGAGTYVWTSGGDSGAGANSGVKEVFWNITRSNGLYINTLPPISSTQFNESITIVGYTGSSTLNSDQNLRWIENVTQPLLPANLYDAQMGLELGGSSGLLDTNPRVLSHSVNLTGLTPGATYTYIIKSSDAAGNLATSPVGTFTVPATPTITAGPTISNLTETSVQVNWTTDFASHSRVDYGLTSSYGSSSTDATLTTTHTRTITGLTGDTEYHFKVTSTDANATTVVSDDDTFTTPAAADVTGPVISAIVDAAQTLTTFTVTWTTDEPASSQIEYGTTAGYGSTTTLDSTLVTSHSVTVTGLTQGTLYHYRILTVDASTNATAGSDRTITTVAADVTAPTFTPDPPTATSVTSTTASLLWNTNEAATTAYRIGTSTGSYGSTVVVSSSLTLSHQVDLTGLSAATNYFIVAVSVDAENNSGQSTERTFTTLAAVDVTAPTVTLLTASALTTETATITWTTNEPATSRVNYGTTTSYGLTAGSDTLVTLHSVTLSGLDDGTVYHYQIVTADTNGNTTTTSTDLNGNTDATFTTNVDSPPIDTEPGWVFQDRVDGTEGPRYQSVSINHGGVLVGQTSFLPSAEPIVRDIQTGLYWRFYVENGGLAIEQVTGTTQDDEFRVNDAVTRQLWQFGVLNGGVFWSIVPNQAELGVTIPSYTRVMITVPSMVLVSIAQPGGTRLAVNTN